MTKWIPLTVVSLFALGILVTLWPKSDPAEGFAVQAFGRLPVLANGRTQPLDSLARNSLLQLREKQTAQTAPWQSDSRELSATEWIMMMMMKPVEADRLPVFRIDHPDVKGLLGVPGEPDAQKQSDGKHYTWLQVSPKLKELGEEAERIDRIEASKRTPYEQAVSRLFAAAWVYTRLQNTLQPPDARNWAEELRSYEANVGAGIEAMRAQQSGAKFDEQDFDRTMRDLERFEAMAKLKPPLLMPPLHPENGHDEWTSTGESLMNLARTGEAPFAVEAYASLATAYRENRVADFNQTVEAYRSALAQKYDAELREGRHEQFFNAYQPFYKAMGIYLTALLCAIAYWFEPRSLEWLRRTAAYLIVLALVVHTSGLLFRMFLQGRPPVTNLYSSAIFIGWGACCLGLILERFWHNSIGLVISGTMGFLTLIIAHHLSLSGDTMEMMRAVLDTNFWLATHVVVVTLGYASTFVAGFLAIIYILRGVLTPSLTPELGKALAKMVYGIVCFATLFSFVGTVLGGIWADQSWGRFWGWDPKENGAMIIVLWNALILHARWGGLVRERGLMMLAIGGNIVTAWSWFGVNMLGIGLHSYGFTDAAFHWLVAFGVSQLMLIAMGALPSSLWRSRSGSTLGTPAPAAA